MTSYEVEAYNTATQSTNRMHDDAVARTYGFRGGLVPGVDVWAYMTRPCVDRWGERFLTAGSMNARFRSPVYDGETVTVEFGDDDALSVIGPDGSERATGSASLEAPPPVRVLDVGDLVVEPPAATSERLTPGTVLSTLSFVYSGSLGASYLEDIRDASPIYDGGAICHPGFLARQANYVLSRTVRLGPWIHVETTAWHRALVHAGDQVEVRGVVGDEYERKGHRIVELDVEITAADAPVWSARHTAIWQPRPAHPER